MTDEPFFSPSSLTESSVITELTRFFPPMSTSTWHMSEPFLMPTTLPEMTLRAPYFMRGFYARKRLGTRDLAYAPRMRSRADELERAAAARVERTGDEIVVSWGARRAWLALWLLVVPCDFVALGVLAFAGRDFVREGPSVLPAALLALAFLGLPAALVTRFALQQTFDRTRIRLSRTTSGGVRARSSAGPIQRQKLDIERVAGFELGHAQTRTRRLYHVRIRGGGDSVELAGAEGDEATERARLELLRAVSEELGA